MRRSAVQSRLLLRQTFHGNANSRFSCLGAISSSLWWQRPNCCWTGLKLTSAQTALFHCFKRNAQDAMKWNATRSSRLGQLAVAQIPEMGLVAVSGTIRRRAESNVKMFLKTLIGLLNHFLIGGGETPGWLLFYGGLSWRAHFSFSLHNKILDYRLDLVHIYFASINIAHCYTVHFCLSLLE